MVLGINFCSLGQMGGSEQQAGGGGRQGRAGEKSRPRKGGPSSPGPVGFEEGREVDDQRQRHCKGPEHQGGEELGHYRAL